MELAIWLFIYAVGITIIVGLLGILANWGISIYFSKKVMHRPKDLSEAYRKQIIDENRCPECGSDNVKDTPAGTDLKNDKGESLGNTGMFDMKECGKCGHSWIIYPEHEPDYPG